MKSHDLVSSTGLIRNPKHMLTQSILKTHHYYDQCIDFQSYVKTPPLNLVVKTSWKARKALPTLKKLEDTTKLCQDTNHTSAMLNDSNSLQDYYFLALRPCKCLAIKQTTLGGRCPY